MLRAVLFSKSVPELFVEPGAHEGKERVKLVEPCFIIPYEEAQFTLSWFINPVQSLRILLTIGVILFMLCVH